MIEAIGTTAKTADKPRFLSPLDLNERLLYFRNSLDDEYNSPEDRGNIKREAATSLVRELLSTSRNGTEDESLTQALNTLASEQWVLSSYDLGGNRDNVDGNSDTYNFHTIYNKDRTWLWDGTITVYEEKESANMTLCRSGAAVKRQLIKLSLNINGNENPDITLDAKFEP